MTNSPTTIALILRYNCTNIATVIVGFNVHDRIHGFWVIQIVVFALLLLKGPPWQTHSCWLLRQLGGSLGLSRDAEWTYSSSSSYVRILANGVTFRCTDTLLQWYFRWILVKPFIWLVFWSMLYMLIKWVQCVSHCNFARRVVNIDCCFCRFISISVRLECIQLSLNSCLPRFPRSNWNVLARDPALVWFDSFHGTLSCNHRKVVLCCGCCIWISMLALKSLFCWPFS